MAAFAAGCASVPARAPLANPVAAWEARQASLARVSAWDVRGRVALRGADEGFSASLLWVRDGERHRIELTGPLGGGRVRLTQDRGVAELRDGNDQVLRDVSMQQLLWRRTGWELPLDGFNHWVLGLPAPGAHAPLDIDPWGRLATLQQAGWEIRFLEYESHGVHELPSRVFIKRATDAANRTLEVRLVIEKWTLRE